MNNTIKFSSFVFILVAIAFVVFANGCKKEKATTKIETGTMTDIDGNTYKTVKIGNKWWMAENLKVSRYSNGDTIKLPQIGQMFDTAFWNNSDSGAYCVIENIDANSQNYKGCKYGYLYNWFAVEDTRNLAPDGWHIPSDSEWKELELFLGMNASELDKLNWRGAKEGDKLKEQIGWSESYDKYVVWGTNESGFNAKGGGACMFNGVWSIPSTTKIGFWWSSSLNGNEAYYRGLDYNKSSVFRYYGPKNYGFSIRCIKD
ncbi:MAG: fibrobacter succinogenes major paralogous domain-containing protein [Bacteroidota bacterium]